MKKICQPQQFVLSVSQQKQLNSASPLTQMISLSGQNLNRLPENIYQCRLRTLILDFNNLEIIDLRLFDCLEECSLVGNHLSNISFNNNLRLLNARNNKLISIDCLQLDSLDVRENPLRQIVIDTKHPKVLLPWSTLFKSVDETVVIQSLRGSISLKSFLIEAMALSNIIVHDSQETEQTERNSDLFDSQILREDCLHQCVLLNDHEVLALLLQNQSPSRKDKFGVTPLYIAIKNEINPCIKYLLSMVDVEEEIDAFHIAIKGGQIGIVKEMLQKGINPNSMNSDGLTCLQTAILNITQRNQHQIVQLLIISGADPNKYNKHDMTVFQICLKKSNLTALKFLLNYNKSVKTYKTMFKFNLKNQSNGDQSLHTAVRYQSIPILNFLLENKIGDFQSCNFANRNVYQLAQDIQRQKMNSNVLQTCVILKLLYKFIVQHNQQFKISTVIQPRTPKKLDSDSSCPSISDDSDDEGPKHKIRAFQEQPEDLLREKQFQIYLLSDDSQGSFEEQSIQEIRHNATNTNLKIQQRDPRLVKLIYLFHKCKLRYSDYAQVFKGSLTSITCLRSEILLYSIMQNTGISLSMSDQDAYFQVTEIKDYITLLEEKCRELQYYTLSYKSSTLFQYESL